MPTMGTYRKLYGKFKFVVRIQNIPFSGYKSCSEFKIDIGEMKYREGGALVPYKEPALVEFSDLTLSRGLGTERDTWAWVMEVVDVLAKLPGGIGVPSPQFFRDGSIDQMDRDDSVAIIRHINWSWPKSYSSGDWDNDAEEVSIEQLVLAFHHGYEEVVA